ncbi:DEAD/DEAH box helicase [Myroides pelagicus]|uniref:Helicase SNF2 n=1 Tax=Myroides pelagicus TaxID=270914 RepID=A0A7K1GPA2_9FLAO|nr:DEAD/DEAH box helicase [Myroides pelagicus]MTH30580.1 helicase SNF2 [Myroides pelagicus]
MAQKFGKTWWGKQWLQALSDIDNGNRLPRGATYARKGAVESIDIKSNVILALVSGSRPKPYKVEVKVPEFNNSNQEKFIKALINKPYIISKFLNRELDPLVLSIAKQAGVSIFPKKWSDLQMKCSCPDYAVPCKHIAAVIYKISQEIDNNPFLVFELHGLDILKQLSLQELTITTCLNKVVRIDELFLSQEEIKPEKTTNDSNNVYDRIVFSQLKPLTNSLDLLLVDNPVFYTNSGNFKDKYKTLLTRVSRSYQRVLDEKITVDKLLNQEETSIDILNQYAFLQVKWTKSYECEFYLNSKKIQWSILVSVLSKLPIDKLKDYQVSVVGLTKLYYTALHLMAKGAMVPQIVELVNGRYTIMWLPALINKQVKEIVSQLRYIIPLEIFTQDVSDNRKFNTEDLTLRLLSVFLTKMVGSVVVKQSKDEFLDMFFCGDQPSFKAPGEDSLPGGINTWLSPYYLSHGNILPQLIIKQDHDNFWLDVTITDKTSESLQNVSLSDILKLKKYDKIRLEVLQSIASLGAYVKELELYIDSQGQVIEYLDNDRLATFLFEVVPVVELLGINVLLPKSLREILKPKVSGRISKVDTVKSFIKLDKLLSFDWKIAIGDDLISEQEFKKLLVNSDTLIKYKSGYIYVSRDELEKLYKHFVNPKAINGLDVLRVALSGEFQGAKIEMDKAAQKLLDNLTTIKPLSVPKGLNASLRPYQKRGYEWLYHNFQLGFGCVLADDMGLGKTLQVITTIVRYKQEDLLQESKVLVIAPTGLLSNWEQEIKKFAPSLTVSIYHGVKRNLNIETDVVLTSYGLARSDGKILNKHKWLSVIIDEAQNIKNSNASQSKAVKSIVAKHYIALSGTPVENRLSELWSIMDYCNSGFLGSPKAFKDSFSTAIELFNDTEAADRLKRTISPFIMRRLKSDKSIISDLPDKIEINAYSALTKQQAILYEKTLESAINTISSIDQNDKTQLFKRQGLVLQMILALKQICNHPTQYLKNKVMDPMLSGKMSLLYDKLDAILDSGEKVLIFTQFKEMGGMLQEFLVDRYNQEVLFYHGGVAVKQRNEMVDNFQTNPAHKIFILSLKAAGTGLNLTAANHVIHYDLWWNPAVEAQATDRAYRIGQKSNVMVHRFITQNTFEQEIDAMIQSKKALSEMTVASGENWIGNLSNKELEDLFVLKK